MQEITFTEYMEVDDTVMVVDEDGNKFDSIYNYIIYVYTPVELPAAEDVDPLPEAVCGEELRVADAVEALKLLFTEDPLTEPVDTITWEVKLSGDYEAVTDQTMPSTLENVQLRYTVVGQCNTQSAELTVPVEHPNSLNMPEKYPQQEAVEKYEGWLLMINYLKLSEHVATLGWEVTEQMVTWYKVNGEPDIITEDIADLADDSVGIGYYYTEDVILNPGDIYYAVIEAPLGEGDDCGGSMFTNLLTIQQGPTPLGLAPNIVKPGDNMYLTGLDRDVEYNIAVYDLTGIRIESFKAVDTESYTIQAQSTAGYYMVQVTSENESVRPETFKYVVKSIKASSIE